MKTKRWMGPLGGVLAIGLAASQAAGEPPAQRSEAVQSPIGSGIEQSQETLFARSTLGQIDLDPPVGMIGHVRFYGQPSRSRLVLTLIDAPPGAYGVYIGRDCQSSRTLKDKNAADKKGTGTSTFREGEVRVGTVVVDKTGQGELDALVTWDDKKDPLAKRVVMLMPAGADRVGAEQFKLACGTIDSAGEKLAGPTKAAAKSK